MSFKVRDTLDVIAGIAAGRRPSVKKVPRRVRVSDSEAGAYGLGPSLIDVLKRHPDWRRRLIHVLTLNDPAQFSRYRSVAALAVAERKSRPSRRAVLHATRRALRGSVTRSEMRATQCWH